MQSQLQGGVLSIGNFDGVHLGHRSLLGRTRDLADKLSGPAIACLFEPHPIVLLRPNAAPKRLTSVTERARRMEQLGVDFLVVCQTSHAMLNLSAEAFFEALVKETLNCRGMVEGENFCFGKGRLGTVDVLTELCSANNIVFSVAEMESTGGESISSTRIRDALATGDVTTAAEWMSAPHRIGGTVAHGDGRGRTIGFPTANLENIDVIIPAPGVYSGVATIASQQNNAQRYKAAIHLGPSPTFDSGAAAKVEVHLLDFSGDLYDQHMTVDFIGQVRGVEKFDSADALSKQLQQDIQSVRQMLNSPPGPHLP